MEETTESVNRAIDNMCADIDNMFGIIKNQQVLIENLTAMSKRDIDMNVSQQKINVFCKQGIDENKQRLDGLDKKFNDLLRLIAEQQAEQR